MPIPVQPNNGAYTAKPASTIATPAHGAVFGMTVGICPLQTAIAPPTMAGV